MNKEMEWNRKIEDKLTQNWQWLMRTVMLKEIVHVLIQDKVVSLDFWMNLKEKQISEQDRNANFFFEVSKFTKDRYRLFVHALRKGGHSDLADMLDITEAEYKKSNKSSLGPKNERIKAELIPKRTKSPDHMSKQGRTPSDIKRENSELRNQLTTISSHVGHLHTVTQNFTGGLAGKDQTFVAGSDSFLQKIHNIEEHEKYLELQETNLKQEMAIKHLRTEIVDLKLELNHQINQLEIKLKDAEVRRELKEHEVDNFVGKITGMKTQINSLTKDLELERGDNKRLQAETEKLTKQNVELQKKIQQQTTAVMSLENDILQVKSERESAKADVQHFAQKLAENEKLLSKQKQENDDLMNEVGDIKYRADELASENKKLSSKNCDFEKVILDMKVKLHKLESEKQRGTLRNSVLPTWR